MQTRKDDTAFPIFDSEGLITDRDKYCSDGLTKREYFAAAALQGFLANHEYFYTVAAEEAVKMADKLIYELNKQSGIQPYEKPNSEK